MDTSFAKIVSDLDGRDHMLIEGTIISIKGGDDDKNNAVVEAIVTGLRGGSRADLGVAQGVTDYERTAAPVGAAA